MEILLFSYCGRVFLSVGSTHQKYQVKILQLISLRLGIVSLLPKFQGQCLRQTEEVDDGACGHQRSNNFDPNQRRTLQRRRSLGELHTGPRLASQYKVVGELPMGPTLIDRTDRMSESGKFRTFVEASRVPILMSG